MKATQKYVKISKWYFKFSIPYKSFDKFWKGFTLANNLSTIFKVARNNLYFAQIMKNPTFMTEIISICDKY